MGKATAKVDGFLRKQKKWKEELSLLREIVLESELVEEVKWMHPCYTLKGKNLIILGGFKACCAISFVKGVLLKDPKKILVSPGEQSQSTKWVKFTSLVEIEKLRGTLKAYIKELIAVEKAGLKVEKKSIEEYEVPEEFERKMREMPELRKAFEGLTPGRRRGYLMHFGVAKQSKTREARVEKWVGTILEGKGMND